MFISLIQLYAKSQVIDHGFFKKSENICKKTPSEISESDLLYSFDRNSEKLEIFEIKKFISSYKKVRIENILIYDNIHIRPDSYWLSDELDFLKLLNHEPLYNQTSNLDINYKNGYLSNNKIDYNDNKNNSLNNNFNKKILPKLYFKILFNY